MLSDELRNLALEAAKQKSETNHLEIKSARQGCPKIYDTLSSFSNQSGGGVILFGLDEAKDYQICGVYDPADLQRKIGEQCLQMEPVLRPLLTVAEMNEVFIVCAEIQEIDIFRRPCFYKGAGRIKGSYVRVGDADRQMTEYEVYSFEAFRKKTQDELREVERATLDDVKTDAFMDYFSKLKINKPNLADLPLDRIQILQGIIIRDHPTLAGILLFSQYPQSFFPQLCITAVVVPGFEMGDTSREGERFIDNARIEGTLPQMVNQAVQFVRRNSAVRTVINPESGLRQDKTEYPVTAVREIILNALIHRDYSIHTDSAPITVVLYKDRLVVENPGGLYGRLTLDTLGTVSADTRNPFLAGAMEVLGETENRFSGIPTIRKAMSQDQLPPPVFDSSRGTFRVTLYHASFAVKYGSDQFPLERLQKEILAFCSVPRNRKELSEQFSQLTPIYLMTRYVNPLVDQGLLQLIIPGKPKSKNQRFKSIS